MAAGNTPLDAAEVVADDRLSLGPVLALVARQHGRPTQIGDLLDVELALDGTHTTRTRSWWRKRAADGVTADEADAIATAFARHPDLLWPNTWADLHEQEHTDA